MEVMARMIRAAVLRRGPWNHTDEAFPHEIRQHLLPVTSVARTLLGRTRGHVRSSQESKNKCTASTTCKSTGCNLEPGASNTCHGAIVHCLLSIVIQRAMSLAAKRSCTPLTPRPTAFFFCGTSTHDSHDSLEPCSSSGTHVQRRHRSGLPKSRADCYTTLHCYLDLPHPLSELSCSRHDGYGPIVNRIVI